MDIDGHSISTQQQVRRQKNYGIKTGMYINENWWLWHAALKKLNVKEVPVRAWSWCAFKSWATTGLDLTGLMKSPSIVQPSDWHLMTVCSCDRPKSCEHAPIEIVLCDLATRSTFWLRKSSMSSAAIPFTIKSFHPATPKHGRPHNWIQHSANNWSRHRKRNLRRQEKKQLRTLTELPVEDRSEWAAVMSLFHKSFATSQILHISSSLRTAAETLSHSHLAFTLFFSCFLTMESC